MSDIPVFLSHIILLLMITLSPYIHTPFLICLAPNYNFLCSSSLNSNWQLVSPLYTLPQLGGIKYTQFLVTSSFLLVDPPREGSDSSWFQATDRASSVGTLVDRLTTSNLTIRLLWMGTQWEMDSRKCSEFLTRIFLLVSWLYPPIIAPAADYWSEWNTNFVNVGMSVHMWQFGVMLSVVYNYWMWFLHLFSICDSFLGFKVAFFFTFATRLTNFSEYFNLFITTVELLTNQPTIVIF